MAKGSIGLRCARCHSGVMLGTDPPIKRGGAGSDRTVLICSDCGATEARSLTWLKRHRLWPPLEHNLLVSPALIKQAALELGNCPKCGAGSFQSPRNVAEMAREGVVLECNGIPGVKDCDAKFRLLDSGELELINP